MSCRTEALGGLEGHCDRCGAEQPRYRSCGDRHCPQCQGRATEAWSEHQSANQLPVPYFHRVFTLPHRLNPWVQSHPEVIYRALFHAAWGTRDAFGHDPKRLGGQLGMTGVLHTWGQSLCQHVHLHCMVPGGALADDGSWVPVQGSYLFPMRALSRHFRGRMVSALRSAAKAGELAGIDPGAISALLDALMGEEWVVFAKPCPGACRAWDCTTVEKRISARFSDPFARPIPAPSPCGAIAQIRSRRANERMNWTAIFWEPRTPEPARARSRPFRGLRATPARRNGGQSGPSDRIERVGPETGHGLPPDALSGAIKGFQGES